MAHISEVKFGELQMDERYKKLERTLKLASLRKGSRNGDESWPLPTSSTISSITTDPFDSSSNIPSLQTSRIGSVVVSSSNNLKDILSKRKDFNSDHERIATSSVKKFNKESDCSNDRLVMPPPNFDNVLRTCKKSKERSVAISQNVRDSVNIAIESPKKKSDYKFSNVNVKHPDNFIPLQTGTNNVQNKKDRIFRQWKVILNEQSQLIIKGTLECGQVARSKPVVRRLTSTSVESVFKHTYHLEGTIVDDKYELPDYVRGKFLNGFPDDWENVYQIWRTFEQQGRIVTFRWPTPVTDSDDDLKSEITDITFAYSKSRKDGMSNLNSFKESRLSSFDPERTYNVLQTKGNQNLSLHNYKKSDSFTQTCISDIIENSFHSREDSNRISKNQFINDKENYVEQETIDINYSEDKSKASKLKDKLNVIVNNLTGKNCPQECITKIIEIFDCLNYVVSHGSVKEDESNIEDSKIKYDKYVIQEERDRTGHTLQDYSQRKIVPLNNSDRDTVANYNLLQRKRTFTEMNKDNNSCTSDSESEIYAGVPKISIERVLRQKETVLRPCKRKLRKKAMPPKHDTMEKQSTSTMPVIPSEYINEGYANALRSEKISGTNFNDSSVSITEDERNNVEPKSYIGSSVQGSADKHIKSDVTSRWNREKWDNSFKDKHLHEMQERFVQENAVVIHESTELGYDDYGVIKYNDRDLVLAKKLKINAPDANSDVEINSDNKDEQRQTRLSCQRSEEISSALKNDIKKMTKPTIISSVPVNIDITNTRSERSAQDQKVIRDGEKPDKDSNEETKNGSVEQGKSPIKFNIGGKANSNSLTDTKKLSEEETNIQPSNRNCSSRKQSRDNIQDFCGKQLSRNSKPKLLSAWTPRVLFKPELHLIFEGKLLNEAGHVVNRKFQTDVVLRRVSPKLIETIHHEFYQLIGELNDSKHVVPKELSNQCRYGCPIRIEQFCRVWNSLQPGNAVTSTDVPRKLDTSMDTINVGVSSKGRRIIPPLSYWTGERIALKDNNPVYSPGILQDSLMISSYDISAKYKEEKNVKQRRKDRSKRSSFAESENITSSSPEMLANEAGKQTTKIEKNKFKNSKTNNKGRTSEQESSVSSDDKGTSVYKRKRTRRRRQEPSGSVNVASKRDTRLITAENSYECYTNFDTTELGPRTKAKGSKEAISSRVSPSKQMYENHQLSARKFRDVVCTYYTDIPVKDDILSDDQVSHV